MEAILDFFALRDVVPLVLIIFLLEFVGNQMATEESPTWRWWARGIAGASFLLYAAMGIATWAPSTAWDFLSLGVRALLAMGTLHGLARVLLPVAGFLYRHLWVRPMERQRAAAEAKARQAATEKERREEAERQQAQQERLAEAERRRQEEIAQQPPPPTREELIAAAKQRYETTLRLLATATLDEIELKAAQERAKQQYVREIDGLMR